MSRRVLGAATSAVTMLALACVTTPPADSVETDSDPNGLETDYPPDDTEAPNLDGRSRECEIVSSQCVETVALGSPWQRTFTGSAVELRFLPEGTLEIPDSWLVWPISDVQGVDAVGGYFVQTPPLEMPGRYAVTLMGLDDHKGIDFRTLAPCELMGGRESCVWNAPDPEFVGHDGTRMLVVIVEPPP